MKLSLLAFLFASVSARTVSKQNAAKVLSNARRLEDANNGDDAAEEEEYAFLMNYKLKMRSCVSGESVVDPETGEYDYNAIVFRLCPASDDCEDESVNGCSEGYGDYIVGLNKFVEAYMEDQGENMQQDDNFNVEEYAECREYENENDDGNGNQYYIGPACTEDGTDVMLQLFSDEACQYVPEDVTFEDISNGWSMPYGDGGLVSNYCTGCAGYDDDGNYELKEMCEQLYENSAGKCETEMETFSYNGRQEGYCERILELLPAPSGGGMVGWIIFIAVGAVMIGYVVWSKQKKTTGSASEGLMA